MAQISYRAARLEDAALAADLMTAGFPREPEDPILTRYRWEHPRGGWSIHRFIGSVDGSDIAYLSSAHSEWSKNPEHHGWLEVYFDQARMDRSALKEMWQWIEEQREGALILNASAAEEETEAHEVLGELGYTLDRTDKVWSLDLSKHQARLSADAAAARANAKQAGVEFTTVAAFQHPDKLRLVHALNERTRQDIPMPLLLVCEDNGLGISVPTPQGWVAAMFAGRSGLEYRYDDGRDPLATLQAAREADRRTAGGWRSTDTCRWRCPFWSSRRCAETSGRVTRVPILTIAAEVWRAGSSCRRWRRRSSSACPLSALTTTRRTRPCCTSMRPWDTSRCPGSAPIRSG